MNSVNSKSGISLIELIFTIVIIATVFTVIPKIVFSLKKSDVFSIRQDAIFNGVSMMSVIAKLPWDEQNNEYDDIMIGTNGSTTIFDCNSTTHYRAGGFAGSRRCENNLNASLIGSDGETGYFTYDDIDDFAGENNISTDPYRIETTVAFKDDAVFLYNTPNQSVTVNLNDTNSTSSNIKRVEMQIYYSGKRGGEKKISQFEYTSTNIGQIYLNKRAW